MRKQSSLTSAVIMFALFCAAVCTLPASTVTLTIAPAEQTVLHLLPACVTAELRNEGDTTTTLGGFGLGGLTLDATRWRLCGFRVRTPDSSDVLVGMTDWIYTDIDIPHRLPVLPGPGTRQSLDYSVSCGVLDQDRKQYKSNSRTVLVAPGTYSVQMLMDQPLSRVESNVARIVVQMPSQPEDIAVYGLLMKLPQPYLLMAQVAGISGCVGRGPEPKYSLGCAEEIKVCTEIVTRYPTSAYAPYARVFLGGLIIVGGTDRPGEVPDREKRLEGMRLLREAVADPRLIRRWRDAALVTIVDSVRSLSDDNRRQGTVSVKPLDEVLGEKVNVPLSSVGLYKAAYLAAKGTGSKDDLQFAQDTLRRYLTSAQIETVKKYALSDPAVEEAINLSPFDLEIETHADWARAELRKIPWRDANTGELTFAAIPKGSR